MKAKVRFISGIRFPWSVIMASSDCPIQRREGLNKQQRDIVPPVIDGRGVADKGENKHVSPADSHHLGMANVERPSTIHLNAKRAERSCLHIVQYFLR